MCHVFQYAAVLVVLIILQVAAGITGAVFRNKVSFLITIL